MHREKTEETLHAKKPVERVDRLSLAIKIIREDGYLEAIDRFLPYDPFHLK
ncbi:hypothetical protein J2Z58_001332 [Halobacillus andaensis]|nr:hypothetical protein [Halobacillus andaensis]